VERELTNPVFALKLLNVIEDVKRVENTLILAVSCVIKEDNVEKDEMANELTA
jgi:hypothetical protein